jgi:PAS domain S-box-containing protein
MQLLLIDDDIAIRGLLQQQLERRGISVTAASDASDGLAALQHAAYDIVVLDQTLPDGSGLDVLTKLRASGSTAHVIIISGATTEADGVRALEAGADDYVVKPFFVQELAARVLAVRRRREPDEDTILDFDRLKIDLTARRVTVDEFPVQLSAKEFGLLAFLAARPGRVFSRSELLQSVWQSAPYWQQASTVTEHIRRLRSKIELNPQQPRSLVTVRGAGYRFDPAADPIGGSGQPAEKQTERPRIGTPVSATDPSARLRHIVTGVLSELSEAVIITDLHSQIRSWNAAAERLYGWAEHEVLGRRIVDVVPWTTDDAELASTWMILEETGRWHGDGRQLTRDGSFVRVAASTTLIRDENHEPMAIVAVNRPVNAAPTSVIELPRHDENEIRRGIRNDEFEVYYQPVVDLKSHRVISVEALVRWNHPERGLLAPDAFIDTAERTGLIIELGTAVLDKACRQCARWRAGGADIELAVNLSTKELSDPGLVDRVTATLEISGLDSRVLWLEVTETALVEDVVQATELLHRLALRGVRIAIDDFGTGWASLMYLRQFPVHALKIDRIFVDGIDRNPSDAAIARSVVLLGEELGLAVVAEGIETFAQEQSLRLLGCTMGQGNLYGRPTPVDAVPIELARAL